MVQLKEPRITAVKASASSLIQPHYLPQTLRKVPFAASDDSPRKTSCRQRLWGSLGKLAIFLLDQPLKLTKSCPEQLQLLTDGDPGCAGREKQKQKQKQKKGGDD